MNPIDALLGVSTPALYIVPAYGRTYATTAAALADWEDGKDFKIFGGPYVSVRDSEALFADGYTVVRICPSTTGIVTQKYVEIDIL